MEKEAFGVQSSNIFETGQAMINVNAEE